MFVNEYVAEYIVKSCTTLVADCEGITDSHAGVYFWSLPFASSLHVEYVC